MTLLELKEQLRKVLLQKFQLLQSHIRHAPSGPCRMGTSRTAFPSDARENISEVTGLAEGTYPLGGKDSGRSAGESASSYTEAVLGDSRVLQ